LMERLIRPLSSKPITLTVTSWPSVRCSRTSLT
jgi:hypothetical protein